MDRMDRNERDLNDAELRAGRNPILHHDDNPSVADEVAEGVGGVSGVLAGAAIGSLGGPIGTIIGGIAGAVSGWWAGRAISEAATHFTHADDAAYRAHYETSGRLADRSYDDVRPAYQLGHLAGYNPDYANRSFDEVESDLRRGWTDDVRARHGDWDSVRGYARDAYERGRSGYRSAGLAGTTATGAAAYGAGRVADAAADLGHDVKRGVENAADATARGVAKAGDKVADAADDLKDRVDGDPASRPGRDFTDRPGR